MKIRVRRPFRYEVHPGKAKDILPGEYEVGVDISPELAVKILKFGKAEKVQPAKVAPENKVVEVAETKVGEDSAPVERKPVRRRRARTESDG